MKKLISYTAAIVAMVVSSLLMVQPAQAQKSHWTGCGAGIHGSLSQNAAINAGGPIDISASAQTLGVSVLCDLQMEKLVFGGFIDADRIWGNITNLGITGSNPMEYVVGGRVGWLPSNNSLLYAHLGRGWAELGGAAGTIESWKYGAGIEIRLPTAAPTFFDLRYTHSDYDTTSKIGVDAKGDQVRIGLTFKFGVPLSSEKVPDPVQYVTPSPEPTPVAPAPQKKSLK